MRQLLPRTALPAATSTRLEEKTNLIKVANAPVQKAETVYTNARKSVWFREVTKSLGHMAGPGERCMFCSGSEAAQVEHFRPKSVFPKLAMTWENFIWACGLCNQFKGNRFPPHNVSGGAFINPVEENVWDFFTLDSRGSLMPRWRIDLDDLDPRAVSMRDNLKLDRDAVQESRRRRRKELVQQVRDTLSLYEQRQLTRHDLRTRRDEWLAAPFQPDVADFYLNGPGREQEPFTALVQIVT